MLHDFVRFFYGLDVPERPLCPGHDAPFAYVAGAFFETFADALVWACRGGGKTELGSVVTHLDSIFKPGCETRILGGSLAQSQRMYEHLSRKWWPHFDHLLIGEPLARRTELRNGATIELLTQSERSVRGQRVPKVKCDEVEEFDPEVWEAVQFVTQSRPAGPGRERVRASLQALSTMHRPYGLMNDLVAQAEAGAFRLFRWCLWEVIEPCRDYDCSRCLLWEDCGGKARRAEGFFSIEDARAISRRSSRESWEAEMLCRRPSREGLVYREFDPTRHVIDYAFDANRPTYAALDFGYTNPTVCLFAQEVDGALVVFHEYYQAEETTATHAQVLRPLFARFAVRRTWADPSAAEARAVLAGVGLRTEPADHDLERGLEAVRSRLKADPVTGRVGLRFDRRVTRTLEELRRYHYAPGTELPVKEDDHAMDALRYLCAGLRQPVRRARVKVTTPGARFWALFSAGRGRRELE
jgi:hypothetical protein